MSVSKRESAATTELSLGGIAQRLSSERDSAEIESCVRTFECGVHFWQQMPM